MSTIESALKVADAASPNSTLAILATAYRNAVARGEKFVYAQEKAEGERDKVKAELATLRAAIQGNRPEASRPLHDMNHPAMGYKPGCPACKAGYAATGAPRPEPRQTLHLENSTAVDVALEYSDGTRGPKYGEGEEREGEEFGEALAVLASEVKRLRTLTGYGIEPRQTANKGE